MRLYRVKPPVRKVSGPPGLTAGASGGEDALPTRELGFTSSVVLLKIHDGELELRPFVNPSIAERATKLALEAGTSSIDAAAVAEAAGSLRYFEAAPPT